MRKYILTVLIIGLYVEGYTRGGVEFKDCSYKFRNRMASFQHHGSYVYPHKILGSRLLSKRKVDKYAITTDNKFQFHLHETLNNEINNETNTSLHIESMEYPNYYLKVQGWKKFAILVQNLNYYDLPEKINIYCSGSCEPVKTENNTEYFESCHLHKMSSEEPWMGSTPFHELLFAKKDIEDMDWIFATQDSDSDDGQFDFTIVSPKTTAYWQKVAQMENCNSTESKTVMATINQSIVRTDGNLSIPVKDLKFGGIKAIKFLELAPDASFSWQRTNIDDMIKTKEHVIGGDESLKVKPGNKLFVYQWIGEAAYFRLATDRVKTCEVPCSVIDKDVDDYCQSQNLIHGAKNIEALKDILCH